VIIVPELETVVLLNPRTGTGSLYRALLAKYDRAFMLYRHMEAEGVPRGYDRWRKVGVVRHPVDRIYSLYLFLKGKHLYQQDLNVDPRQLEWIRRSVDCSFEDYLLYNETMYPTGHICQQSMLFSPIRTVALGIAYNRVSQFQFLRPDLGTYTYGYETSYGNLLTDLGLGKKLDYRCNATLFRELGIATPKLTPDAVRYCQRVFDWELQNFNYSMSSWEEDNAS